jgi:hypothetical protein
MYAFSVYLKKLPKGLETLGQLVFAKNKFLSYFNIKY